MLTELFGIQTYLVNGVRSSKKTGSKAIMYQPGSVLELEAYHNETKDIQRIKEANRACVMEEVLSNVVKNSIALFMVEVLAKIIKQPEADAGLFYFTEDILAQLDVLPAAEAANLPLFFALQLPQFFGFKIAEASPRLLESTFFLDLQEGEFTAAEPLHEYVLTGTAAAQTATLLQITHPGELREITITRKQRQELLQAYMRYYALHIHDFGPLKTLQVMQEVWG